MTKCVFSKAWAKLKIGLEDKTSWGKTELKNLMFICLENAALEDDNERHGNDD